MSRKPAPAPIVAELGRPETAEETAARKAESSRIYRSSQSVRNLIAALVVTLAIVAVIVFAVPRGEPTARPEIDVAAIAADVESTMQSAVLVPEVSDFWRVNAAELEGGATVVWNITLAPADDDERGFIKVAQAFDADASWAPQVLDGHAADDSTTIDGIRWDVYDIGSGGDANVRYALGTTIGDDYLLLYGSRTAAQTAELAEELSPQITELQEAS
ncbi:DUF4245 family protein [Microbacterium sp. NPDC055903]